MKSYTLEIEGVICKIKIEDEIITIKYKEQTLVDFIFNIKRMETLKAKHIEKYLRDRELI